MLPDPGPLGGGAYTGPLVTKTLLFIGLRGSEAPDLVFGTPDAAATAIEARRSDATAPPELRAVDKVTGATVHSVDPAGRPDRQSDDLHGQRPPVHRARLRRGELDGPSRAGIALTLVDSVGCSVAPVVCSPDPVEC